jgi:hypothetical protein
MKRKEAIDQLREIQEIGDLKVAHRLADDILCGLLQSLGYGDVVAEYNKVGKWYDSPIAARRYSQRTTFPHCSSLLHFSTFRRSGNGDSDLINDRFGAP